MWVPIQQCLHHYWAGAIPKYKNETVQVTLEWMKTDLSEDQTNFPCAQKCMATKMNRLCSSEEFQVDDEMVLSTKNIKNFCPHLPAKIKARWLAQLILQDQKRISGVCLRFLASISDGATLPYHQIQALGTFNLTPRNHLHFILLLTMDHDARRW